jgi:aminopeptidase N
MDKWFILQSTSPAADALSNVRGLLKHRSFTMSNPNRVRSLIGAFASSNPAAFHAEDGSGISSWWRC